MSALQEKLQSIRGRHEELASLMSQPDLSGDEFSKLSMEYAELSPVVEAIDEQAAALAEKEDLNEMLSDPEMKEIAAEELRAIEAKLPKLDHKINGGTTKKF